MKEVYEEIKQLDTLNVGGSLLTHLGKLTEEIGELASDVNLLSGNKVNKHDLTDAEILANLRTEAADSIQIIMVICSRAGITYEELRDEIALKNKVWKTDYLDKKQKADV